MISFKFNNYIQWEDDFIVLTRFKNNQEEILLKTEFDFFKDYELYEYTKEFEYGLDLWDKMEYVEELNCFVYNDFRLYVIQPIIKR